jgi:hypothetical protein
VTANQDRDEIRATPLVGRLRAQIRAAEIIERLRAHALGEIDLSPMQIRVAEILLRKVIPGFRAGWVLNCGRRRGERYHRPARHQR